MRREAAIRLPVHHTRFFPTRERPILIEIHTDVLGRFGRAFSLGQTIRISEETSKSVHYTTLDLYDFGYEAD
jgi:hypothetical protein